MRHDLVLSGCRPLPLALYLKALGILRVVSEQVDPAATGAWSEDVFVLGTRLDRAGLLRFLTEAYEPTPIIAPWNGGSGFYPKDNKTGIDAISNAGGLRWQAYAEAIAIARSVVAELGLTAKPTEDRKVCLLAQLRAVLPDAAIAWMDAALLLTDDADAQVAGVSFGAMPKYPPLLGTGGNDGRLDFTNNFMQRLMEMFPPGAPTPASTVALAEHACFGVPVDGLIGAAIGQFLPGGIGGPNLGSGFDSAAAFNPWDFVLMLEGAVCFAAAAVRRHAQETRGAMAFPFTVHGIGSGYGSACAKDEADSRAELWLPLWERGARADEIVNLLAEGRVRVGRRSARNGADFARAVVSLGIDRGLSAFERVGFQVRNGLSYLATPLGRVEVRASGAGDPLQEVDSWLDSFRTAASDRLAPASASRALRALDAAVFDYCQRPEDDGRLLEILVNLGGCERAMVKSHKWTKDKRLRPIPRLNPDRWWARLSGAMSTELRIALALASARVPSATGGEDPSANTRRLRESIEPVEGRWPAWLEVASRDVVWTDGDPVDGLCAIMWRLVLGAGRDGASKWPVVGRVAGSLDDVSEFIERRTDDHRLAALLWASILFDYDRKRLPPIPLAPEEAADTALAAAPVAALYGVCKLCFAGVPIEMQTGSLRTQLEIPLVPNIVRTLMSGDGSRASELALRRLRASGVAPAVRRLATAPGSDLARRIAAALLIPISAKAMKELVRTALRRSDKDSRSDLSVQP